MKDFVLELYYNQGKTYHEISKETRISPRDIGVVLNKIIEEKTEGIKQQDNVDSKKNQEQLFPLKLTNSSDTKNPLEVAIALNPIKSEVTKFYKEYWKLKQLHNLNMVYEETKGDIESFPRLYRLSKAAGMSARHVINLLEIANTNLPEIECRYERLRREVNTLEFNKQQSHIALSYFNNQIDMKSKALTSFRISCIRERREIENLYNEKARLEALITGFKSNNEEYLKIKETAEEKVKHVLNDRKILLQLRHFSSWLLTKSLIEELIINIYLIHLWITIQIVN